MWDWLQWFVDEGNRKTFLLVLFFVTFVAIVLYVYTGKRRQKRLESYKYIPLDDDDARTGAAPGKDTRDE